MIRSGQSLLLPLRTMDSDLWIWSPSMWLHTQLQTVPLQERDHFLLRPTGSCHVEEAERGGPPNLTFSPNGLHLEILSIIILNRTSEKRPALLEANPNWEWTLLPQLWTATSSMAHFNPMSHLKTELYVLRFNQIFFFYNFIPYYMTSIEVWFFKVEQILIYKLCVKKASPLLCRNYH